ncbi:MAG TPA: hypothetical protein VFQ45_03460 [Longimicrobium sp.]|nr:hypothetical protein [Longimicrobium sp.]
MPEQRPSLVSSIGDQLTGPVTDALKRVVPGGPGAGALLEALPGDFMEKAARTLVDRMRELLNTPLDQVLAGAWRKYDGFTEFADTTRHPPGEVNVVELAQHTVRWTQQPAVDVAFQGNVLATLHLGIQVEIKLDGGRVTVQDGHFKSLSVGTLHINARVSLEGDQVAKYEDTLKIPGELQFGDGIAIAPQRAAAAIAVPSIVRDPAQVN